MKRSISIVAQSVFLLMCSVTAAQTPDRALSTSESPGMLQQIADITVLGDSGVVIEILDKESGSVTQKVVLGGPNVKLTSGLGEAFKVNDLNSPSVAALLEDNAAVFLGDLELTTTASNPDSSKSDYWRVTAYNALVEIRTERVADSQVQKPAVSLGERPLNQRAEHIRAVLEEVRRRRSQ